MDAIVAAAITGAVSLIGIAVGLHRNKRRVQELGDAVGNGLQSVITEIHREMTLTVLPELAEARRFREALDDLHLVPSDQIHRWMTETDARADQIQRRIDDQLHSQTALIDALKSQIETTHADLLRHDEWERTNKYDESRKASQ